MARKFDLIFIDGLHEAEQVLRDVDNALEALNPNGIILVHDAKPLFADEATFPMPKDIVFWNGTVWKAIAYLRTKPHFDVATADFDWGIAVIKLRPNSDVITSAETRRAFEADHSCRDKKNFDFLVFGFSDSPPQFNFFSNN